MQFGLPHTQVLQNARGNATTAGDPIATARRALTVTMDMTLLKIAAPVFHAMAMQMLHLARVSAWRAGAGLLPVM